MIRVEGHKNLFRDEETGAIVNCDTYEYQKYINMRTEKKKQKEEIEKLKLSNGEIKQELNEIKALLMEILNGSK